MPCVLFCGACRDPIVVSWPKEENLSDLRHELMLKGWFLGQYIFETDFATVPVCPRCKHGRLPAPRALAGRG